MLSPEAHKRLTERRQETELDGFVTKVAKDRWILHAPSKFITIGNMDPALDEAEKRQGFVSKDEFARWMSDHPTEKAQWEGPESELITLQDLITVAAGGDEEQRPGTYFCEIAWSTLDMPEDAGASVTYNIRVQ